MKISTRLDVELVVDDSMITLADVMLEDDYDQYNRLTKCIEDNLHLLPRWCQKIQIFYDRDLDGSNGNGAPATMDTSIGYRMCTLTLYDEILDLTEAEVEAIIIHEFMHVTIEGTVTLFWNTIDSMEIPKFAKLALHEVLSTSLESSVTDLTEIILRDRLIKGYVVYSTGDGQ